MTVARRRIAPALTALADPGRVATLAGKAKIGSPSGDSGELTVVRERPLTCSPLLMRPFARWIRTEGVRLPGGLATRFEAVEALPERIPVSFLRESIGELLSATGDSSIGLRAA